MSPLTEPTRLTLAKSWDLAGFDPDAAAYIQRVEWADTTPLEDTTRTAINSFVLGCKTDGIWSAIKASCILAGARTLKGALMPLVGAAPTNFNFVSGDYNRKTGLVGDGSTKYLDSGRNNNADPQDNVHRSIYQTDVHSGVSAAQIGAGWVGSGSDQIWIRPGNNDSGARCRSSIFTGSYPLPTNNSLQSISRTAGANYQYRVIGQNYTISITSQAPFNGNHFVYATNNFGVAAAYSNARLAFYSIGESLDLALLDARVTDLITAIGVAF